MATRFGLGPVFAFEWQIAARRWRGYAGRAGFIACLLAGMTTVYLWNDDRGAAATLRTQAEFGVLFFYAIVGTQLALVMLAAPAATAGAVCLDKARGTLMHVLVTDLADAEIVLGKLAARLLPTVMLVACVLPVMALGTLLGGIDPVALTGAFLVTMGVAILGCAVAFTLSVWGTKTQEVLMGTYAFWILFFLASPIDGQIRRLLPTGIPPLRWLGDAEPFRLAFAPYLWPGTTTIADDLGFLAGAIVVAVALAALCVARLRAVAIRQANASPKSARVAGGRIRIRIPGPSLDFNPVLWREWHRNRPSRGARILWGVYIGGAVVMAGVATVSGTMTAFIVNAFQVPVGLLMLATSSASSLGEERVRGSLDVLMATPLSTTRIVLGKWWGSVHRVPFLALVVMLPPLGGLVGVFQGSGRVFEALFSIGVLVFFVLATGTAVGTLGLALATWIKRPGRAIAWNVGAVVFMSAGWFFLIVMATMRNAREGQNLAMASPFFGSVVLTAMASDQGVRDGQFWEYQIWGIAWAIAYLLATCGLLALTLLTFNHCLGRMVEIVVPTWSGPRPNLVDPAVALLDGAESRTDPVHSTA